MRKTRVTFLVEVNLDPVPGMFDNAKDVEATLKDWGNRFPWYNPTIRFCGSRQVAQATLESLQEELEPRERE